MAKPLIRVAVTGGAGQIAYNLLFRIANGEVFGPDQPIALHILELPEVMKMLEGTVMELEDCAFPLLQEIVAGSNPYEVFQGVNWALLVGAKPRGSGMERSDLLRDNSKIFVEQGKALNVAADRNVKTIVIGNPCNTNCLIAMQNAPHLPPQNFYAMTRLDENRAKALLAKKSNTHVKDVTNVIIWGNHSSTLVPDFTHATIHSLPVREVIKDHHWLENEFIEKVQKRGAEVIAARGKSSAASAANAVIDSVKSLCMPTKEGEWVSFGVYTRNNPYGIDENLFFSFPIFVKADGSYEIVKNLHWSEFIRNKIKITEDELITERKIV